MTFCGEPSDWTKRLSHESLGAVQHLDPTFLESFKENPLPMFAAFVCMAGGLLLLLLGFLSLKKAPALAGTMGWLTLVMGVCAMIAGAGGSLETQRRLQMINSTPGLSVNDKTRITRFAMGNAVHYFESGIALGILPLLAGVALGVAGRKRAKRA